MSWVDVAQLAPVGPRAPELQNQLPVLRSYEALQPEPQPTGQTVVQEVLPEVSRLEAVEGKFTPPRTR